MRYINLLESITGFHGSGNADPKFSAFHTGNNSTSFGEYNSNRHGVFFSNNPTFAGLYGSNIIQYTLNVKNVASDLLEEAYHFSNSIDAHGENRDIWIMAKNIDRAGKEWHLFEDELGDKFVPWLIHKGYDSAQFIEYNEDDHSNEHESLTTVVFDPSLIQKSGKV